jgi:hypothetical protein
MGETTDYIYRKGASPNTKSTVSQKNKVFAFSTGKALAQIGNLATFNPSESKTIDTVRGIGFGDQIAELVPSVTEAMTLSVSRAMLYLQNFHQVFGYKGGAEGLVRSLKHHRWPFDIKQELVISHLVNRDAGALPGLVGSSEDSATMAIITFFEACWINSYGASYSADSAIVNEDLDITASDVFDNAGTYAADYGKLQLDNSVAETLGVAGEGQSIRFAKPAGF